MYLICDQFLGEAILICFHPRNVVTVMLFFLAISVEDDRRNTNEEKQIKEKMTLGIKLIDG